MSNISYYLSLTFQTINLSRNISLPDLKSTPQCVAEEHAKYIAMHVVIHIDTISSRFSSNSELLVKSWKYGSSLLIAKWITGIWH